MDVIFILYDCAIILFATKLLGMLSRRLGLPQVVGMIIAGLLIGPAIFGQLGLGNFRGLIAPAADSVELTVLHCFSQIGVVFILFSSGLETSFSDLKKSGFASSLVAVFGVVVPTALGTLGALAFMRGFGAGFTQEKLMNALFVGTILSATSVGITVETLRELGKLNTRVGTTILSAAIIDDVLGIILLSIVTGIQSGGNILITLLKILGFFVFTIGIGIPLRLLFKWLVSIYPHKRRTSIFALVMCFLYAFCAEKLFGIAAITGAYMAGLMLSGLNDTSFVDRKVVVSGYMIFTPMFFAYIGISADFSGFEPSILAFAAVFVLLGIIGKIVGCGGIAKLLGYNAKDSLATGCGMIARGEVALAVYATGHCLIAPSGGIDPLIPTIFLIICSSILCPILLKLTLKNSDHPSDGSDRVIKTRISAEALDNIHNETNK